MLIKLGVDISRLNNQIRRSLNKIDTVFNNCGFESVITSTYEGSHSPSSLHYTNNAIDIRTPSANVDKVINNLRSRLGSDFDIVLEPTHIHIEYDPVDN